jgi:hypothetical protein
MRHHLQHALTAKDTSSSTSQGSQEGLYLQWMRILNIKLLHSQGTVVKIRHPYRKVNSKVLPQDHCCGSGMFIPDPGYDFFPSRIRTVSISVRIKELFYPQKWFLSSRKYDPGCSSRIPNADFLPALWNRNRRNRNFFDYRNRNCNVLKSRNRNNN